MSSNDELQHREFFTDTSKLGIMSAEEIDQLDKTIGKTALSMLRDDTTWKKAFAIYNAVPGQTLSMQCSPCYMKVLMYFKSKQNGK